MDSWWPVFDAARYPRTYRPALWYLLLMLGLGGALMLGGLLIGAWHFAGAQAPLLKMLKHVPLPLAPVLFVLGVYLVVDTLKSRLLLHADTIEIQDARRPRHARFADLAGYRSDPARGGLILVPRPGAGRPLSLPMVFGTDADLQAWIRRLEDLDATAMRQAYEAFVHNPAYGADEAQRLHRLWVASWVPKVAGGLLVAVFVASLWLGPLPPGLKAALALAPCGVLLMPWLSRGLLRLDEGGHDVRPSLSAVLLLACLLPLGPLLDDANLAGWQATWPWGVGAGMLLGLPVLRAGWEARQRWLGVVMAALLCTHATVALAWINVAGAQRSDAAEVRTHATVVAYKQAPAGRPWGYELRLEPWGSQLDAQRVSVPRERFNAVSPGETVCVQEHPGLLGWPWYSVAACTLDNGQDPVQAAVDRRLRQQAHGPGRRGPLARLLVAQQYDELDRQLTELQRRFEQGQLADQALLVALRDFYDPDPALDPLFERWIMQFPSSYGTWLARGIHHKYQAEAVGSAGFEAAVSPRINAQVYVDRQVQDLERSTRLTARPVLSYVHLMDAAQRLRQPARMREWLDRGLAADPASLVLRRKYLALQRPMFGGSLDAMESFVQETQRRGAPPQVLSALEGLVVMQRGWDRQDQGDEDGALALFRQAATLGLVDEDLGLALRQEAHILIGRGQFAQALALLDRGLQADPGQRRSLGLRGWALERLQRLPEARAAYEQAAQRGDTWSQVRLGRMHLLGEGGVPVDRGLAAHWLTQAAQAGDKEAKQLLRQHPDLAAAAASKPE